MLKVLVFSTAHCNFLRKIILVVSNFFHLPGIDNDLDWLDLDWHAGSGSTPLYKTMMETRITVVCFLRCRKAEGCAEEPGR